MIKRSSFLKSKSHYKRFVYFENLKKVFIVVFSLFLNLTLLSGNLFSDVSLVLNLTFASFVVAVIFNTIGFIIFSISEAMQPIGIQTGGFVTPGSPVVIMAMSNPNKKQLAEFVYPELWHKTDPFQFPMPFFSGWSTTYLANFAGLTRVSEIQGKHIIGNRGFRLPLLKARESMIEWLKERDDLNGFENALRVKTKKHYNDSFIKSISSLIHPEPDYFYAYGEQLWQLSYISLEAMGYSHQEIINRLKVVLMELAKKKSFSDSLMEAGVNMSKLKDYFLKEDSEFAYKNYLIDLVLNGGTRDVLKGDWNFVYSRMNDNAFFKDSRMKEKVVINKDFIAKFKKIAPEVFAKYLSEKLDINEEDALSIIKKTYFMIVRDDSSFRDRITTGSYFSELYSNDRVFENVLVISQDAIVDFIRNLNIPVDRINQKEIIEIEKTIDHPNLDLPIYSAA